MINVDTTKTGGTRHRSGLTRVTARLLEALGAAAEPVTWPFAVRPGRNQDWFLTAELFSEEERPGFTGFLDAHRGRTAAIFHDAIPLRHPHITWPQSVARHPAYMKLLARFERIWAVSAAARDELIGFWRWQGVAPAPRVEVIALGADFDGAPRTVPGTTGGSGAAPPLLLSVGIVEPRKNQLFLLEVCANLWRSGCAFELHVVGRVNPHFGRPIVQRINAAAKTHPTLHFHEAADDRTLAALLTRARATVFPTLAEGCGLPLLESLWRGVPCVCSDLPVLRENAQGGGCVAVAANDAAAWQSVLRRIVTDDAFQGALAAQAMSRALPTWSDTARTIVQALS